MAANEYVGLQKYKDKDGNVNILYPVSKGDAIELSDEAIAALSMEGSTAEDALLSLNEKINNAGGTVGIKSIVQTTKSTADGGDNIWTASLTDGSVSTFTVKNGSQGSAGETGPQGPKGDKGDKGDTGPQGPAGVNATTTEVATTTSNGLMSASDKVKLNNLSASSGSITVDTALSSTSTNPVQNKVINSALSGKSDNGHTHNYAGASSAGGAANSALKLQTARTINGVSFNGTANITVPRSIKHVHATDGGSGVSGYAKICTIQVTAAYANHPFKMTLSQRGIPQYDIVILFSNSSSTQPPIGEAYYISYMRGYTPVIYYCSNGSGYDIYVKKTEAYDHIYVLDLLKADADEGKFYTITWSTDSAVSSVPSGSVKIANVFGSMITKDADDYAAADHTHTTLGTSTVGANNKPIYLNNGVPTPLSGSEGSSCQPIYLSNGELKGFSRDIGSRTKPIYLDGGDLTECDDVAAQTGTTNSTSGPLYLVGALSQSESAKTYSNMKCYIANNCLYSNGSKVAFESHTHSNYAASNHTHSEYASSSHSHSTLTIQGNGTSLGSYTGSAAKTINITPSNIGAAAASHGTHIPGFATDITNWNTTTKCGFYKGQGATGAPDANNWFMGIVLAHNNSYVVQIVWKFASDVALSECYQRACVNGTWKAWTKLVVT